MDLALNAYEMETFPFSNAPKPTLLVGRRPFDALCWLLLLNAHSFSEFVAKLSHGVSSPFLPFGVHLNFPFHLLVMAASLSYIR